MRQNMAILKTMEHLNSKYNNNVVNKTAEQLIEQYSFNINDFYTFITFKLSSLDLLPQAVKLFAHISYDINKLRDPVIIYVKTLCSTTK